MPTTKRDLMYFLFSFQGRINRAPYWAYAITTGVIGLLITYAAMSRLGIGWIDFPKYLVPGPLALSQPAVTLRIWLTAMGLVFIVPTTAITVKRLHDRNKSGWWVIVFVLIPWLLTIYRYYALDLFGFSRPLDASFNIFGSLVGLWALIEFGILSGTAGDNRFGPDPLPPEAHEKPAGLA